MKRKLTHIFRWDLDKTYLDTDFDSIRALIRIAFEKAEEKRTLPGAAALMRALKSGPSGAQHRIEVLSGSPEQMRRVLIKKFRLDGVEIDGLTLKDNLKNVVRGRFRAVRDQIGYKLPALLESRLTVDPSVREICFGDDSETDAIVYRLYADLCAGRISDDVLESILDAARLYPDQQTRVWEALRTLPRIDPVDRILIHLEGHTPTVQFHALGERVLPIFNAFQSSLVLVGDGILSMDALDDIVHSMVVQHEYTPRRLANSMEDAMRRGLIPLPLAMDVSETLKLQVRPQRVATQSQETVLDYPVLITLAHQRREEHARQMRKPTMREFLFGKRESDKS